VRFREVTFGVSEGVVVGWQGRRVRLRARPGAAYVRAAARRVRERRVEAAGRARLPRAGPRVSLEGQSGGGVRRSQWLK